MKRRTMAKKALKKLYRETRQEREQRSEKESGINRSLTCRLTKAGHLKERTVELSGIREEAPQTELLEGAQRDKDLMLGGLSIEGEKRNRGNAPPEPMGITSFRRTAAEIIDRVRAEEKKHLSIAAKSNKEMETRAL